MNKEENLSELYLNSLNDIQRKALDIAIKSLESSFQPGSKLLNNLRGHFRTIQ